MGSCSFITRAKGANAQTAFINARAEAENEFGRCGYTGSIAEKRQFVIIGAVPTFVNREQQTDWVSDLTHSGRDSRIDDKWGPAGCIKDQFGVDTWIFFGWASE